MKKVLISLFVLMVFAGIQAAQAGIQEKSVLYSHGEVKLQGFLAGDDSTSEKRPAILVVHDWNGLGDYEKSRTRQLAELGYVAFALDMYGQGIRPRNKKESAQQSKIYKSDRKLMRARARAGLDRLLSDSRVDPKRVAVIGYCFGGTTVLELARAGEDVAGVVSFHGNLDTPTPGDAKNIKAKVLVLHGADDPYVPDAQIAAFQDEMRRAKVDWQMIYYSGAVHSFTNPEAGNDNSKGAAYNAQADQRSWRAMQDFYSELFR